MKIFEPLTKMRIARARVIMARQQLATSTDALLARGRQHPLATTGVAAGVGFVLGVLPLRSTRIPGLGALLGGTGGAMALATRLLAEWGAAGLLAASGDDPAQDIDTHANDTSFTP